ncbi:MAG: 4Fe-4S binding protein [Gammaproteobacteria bacterium]|nr:4Fe-4S binding protein [Gammaproteobacteria bacterium]
MLPTGTLIIGVVFILGTHSQIVQAILIRESLVVFYGNEVSLGIFYGSWLFWVAVGSLGALHLSARSVSSRPHSLLPGLVLSLPLLLILQILSLRLVRLVLDVSSSEFVPLDELFFSLFLINAPSALVLGFIFPFACHVCQPNSGTGNGSGTVGIVSGLYVADALGALVGGMLFTFVLIQWMGVAGSLGITVVLLSVTAWMIGKRRRAIRSIACIMGLAGLTLLFPQGMQWLEKQLETMRFSTLQPSLVLVDSLNTRYGHLAVAQLEDQTSIVVDGQITESFPLPREIQQQAAYLLSQAVGARRLLLFGNYADGLVAELLRYPIDSIDLVVEDQQSYELVYSHLPEMTRNALQDPRVRIHFFDGRRFVNQLSKDQRFDLVLVLNASPASAYSNRYFTREFYERVGKQLGTLGVLCTRVSSASNYLGKTVGSYSGSVFHTLREQLPEIAIVPGDNHVYCATRALDRVTEDPGELERRYLAIPLNEHRYPAMGFHSLLSAADIQYIRKHLAKTETSINSDQHPITYYLNMVLWGHFTTSNFTILMERLRHQGGGSYLLPLILFVALWLLRNGLEETARPVIRRKAAGLSITTLGFVAMAAQLVILFSYQAHVGFMFERVALINALFMTGLALGAGMGRWLAATRSPVPVLMSVMGLTGSAFAALPHWLVQLGTVPALQEPGYLATSLALGMLTGSGFPLGIRITQQERSAAMRSGGINQAADSLGGAVGGLVTGTLLVPVMGIPGSCYLLSVFALLNLVPLLFAQTASDRLLALSPRGRSAFPWPGLGWGLTFMVLLVSASVLLQQGPESAPQTRFDDRLLNQISESSRFELHEQPFDHYLGSNSALEENTVSGASMAIAPGIRGYAGPINLLISIQNTGVLKGVRYIDSNETPSYIGGIDGWLAGLKGLDLSKQSLTLQQVDSLTGATVTSQAALMVINESVAGMGMAAFDKPLAAGGEASDPQPFWYSARFMVTALVLIVFFPVYLSGSEPGRLVLQLASLAVLGLWFNSLVTEVDLVNLMSGHFSSPRENPQRWLLLGFVLVSALLFGQVWCGYLCPFGALQEFVSRLGRWLGLRAYPERSLNTRLRFLKFLLLALLLIGTGLTGDASLAMFNPMQHVFGGQWGSWMAGITGMAVIGSLFYFRFWCRYFCPFGAFLALSNKLALLNGMAPKRRFEHCDLGVREEFDIDCIRCNRCLTGKDTHLRQR